MNLAPPRSPFFGCTISPSAQGYNVALFAASHGTPYPGIDNSIHAATATALRSALGADAEWLDHWDFDLDGPLLGSKGYRIADLGDESHHPA